MNIDRFWRIIEQSRRAIDPENADGNLERQSRALATLLSRLPPDEIISFADHQYERLIEAYDWKLWAAAYLIGHGCSDDWFEYFRRWLLSMGRRVYERALADADSLADVVERPDVEDIFFEEFTRVVYDVYEQKTGQKVPARHRKYPKSPTGAEWNEDDMGYFQRELPRLWALYGARMEGSG